MNLLTYIASRGLSVIAELLVTSMIMAASGVTAVSYCLLSALSFLTELFRHLLSWAYLPLGHLGHAPLWAVDRKCSKVKISHTAVIGFAARVAKQNRGGKETAFDSYIRQ